MPVASQQQIQVLHVDDEPDFADLTTTFLERENDRFSVETATSANEGLEILADRPPDCVVSDYNMPGMDGITFLQAVREEYPDLPFILFTGKGSEAVASDAIAAGVTDYLQKGSGSEQYELLANRIENAVTIHRSQQVAQQRKERLELFFRESPLGSIQWDQNVQVERLNEQAENILGYDEAELRGKSWETIVAEDDCDRAGDTAAKLRTAEGGQYAVNRNVRKDGKIRTIEWHNRTVTDADGTVQSIFSKFQDVTERENRKSELKEYETIIKALTDAVYVLDEEGRFTYVNDEFVELVGYDRETIIGSTPSLIKDAAAVEQAEQQLGRLLSSDGPDTLTFEVTVHPRDGDPIVCEDHMGVLPYEGDQFNGSVGTLRDITDRKARERELAQTHDLMRNMEVSADAGAWEYDPETERLMLTDGAHRLYGHDPDTDLTLEEAFDAFHPSDRDLLRERFDTCLETGEPYEVEVRFTTPDGEQRWITARGERVAADGNTSVVRGYIQDITEQKQLERDLKQERDLVSGIVETVPVGLSVVDGDGSISFVNERLESICGRSLKELEDMPHDDARYDLVDEHGESLESGETPFNRVVSRETAIHNQVVGIRRPSGERVWLSVSGAPQYDDGELERTVFTFEDITDRRSRERNLERYQTALNELPDPVVVYDEDGQYDIVNQAAAEVRGAPREELTGTKSRYLEQIREETSAEYDALLEGKRDSLRVELTAEFSGPGTRTFECRFSRITETADPNEVVMTTRDVTDRNERERKLELVETLFANAQECQFIVDVADGAFELRHANDYYKRTVGLSPGEPVTGQTPAELFGDTGGQEILDRYRECVETHESVTYTVEVPVPEEGTVYRTILAPVVTDDEVTHIVGTARDITDHKHRKEKLKRQNNRLEEFASVVSHDLRNPLRVADGRLELIREECESDHIDDVAQALDRMDVLIEDLLTLARGGDQVGDVEPVVLADLVDDCWQNIATPDAEVVPTVDRTIRADRSRLQQLLENLFRNAIEHGDEDATVTIGELESGFFVQDDGPGISEENRNEVFDAGYSTSSEGTGFGLRIVKQVVDAHGWTVAVTESEQGGARFEITGVEFADR